MRTLILLLAAVAGAPATAAPTVQMASRAYEPDTADFLNPERGLSSASGGFDAARKAGLSLAHVYFRLDPYRDTPLPPAYLGQLRQTFAKARRDGVKLVVRFTYNFPAGPPYTPADADASLERVMSHLDQLAPVLSDNSDVIAFLEAGFIGAWGEWHHSAQGLETTAAKRAVAAKLLRVLPASRMVALRYPRDKVEVLGRTTPVTAAEAFSDADAARLAHHNDCFLAAPEDWGTYQPSDPSAITAQKRYLAQDSRFVVQGGETCNAGPQAQPFIQCKAALADLAAQHWSQLNGDYHPEVLALWRTQGCLPEISRRLGYRLRLTGASLQTRAGPGDVLRGEIRLVNDGFAAPYNPRGLQLVLRNRRTGARHVLPIADDPRRWMPGEAHTIRLAVTLPAGTEPGAYDALLNLPDPVPRLRDRPEYAIRLANRGVWEPSTGFNALGLVVQVTNPSQEGASTR